jgi:hypothetical protein
VSTGPEFLARWAPLSARNLSRGFSRWPRACWLPSTFPTILAIKERSMNAHERPVITEDDKTAVRAGSTGNNVRYVLIGSVALAIIAWILVEYFVRL